jgi:hypothetical protein
MKKAAECFLLSFPAVTLIFHGLVLMKLIPFRIVIGGRLQTVSILSGILFLNILLIQQ